MPQPLAPYDPEALAHLTACATQVADRVAALLQRKADRADALREVAAAEQDEKAYRAATSLDKEVLLMIELIQSYKLVISQHEADNASAWSMIELQDKRCTAFKHHAQANRQHAHYWQAEAGRQAGFFAQIQDAFTIYVQRQQAA